MKNLEIMFEKCFKMPFPKEMYYHKDNESKGNTVTEISRCLYGNDTAVRYAEKRCLPLNMSLDIFNEECFTDFYLAGFWGHGVNSYAFYYMLVDSWRKLLFVLPYGGVYMDNNIMAEKIRKFLRNYLDFEEKLYKTGRHITFVESVFRREEYYEIVDWDGITHISPKENTGKNKTETLYKKPDFTRRFDHILSKVPYNNDAIRWAIHLFKERIKKDPRDTKAIEGLNNLSAMVGIVHSIEMEKEKKRYLLLYEKGINFLEKNDYTGAIGYFTKAIEDNAKYFDAYMKRGSVLAENLGDYEGAIKDFTKAIELDQDFGCAYNNRGNAYHAKGEYEKAIKDYYRAVELNPNDPYAYCNRANAHIFNVELQKGIDDYKKAISLNPGEINFYFLLSRAYVLQGKTLEGIDALHEALKVEPDNEEVQKELVHLMDHAKSSSLITDVGDANKPGTAVWYFHQGFKLQDESKFIEAIEKYDSAIALHKKYIDAYFNKGVCHVELKDYKSAIKDFVTVLSLNPKDADAHYNLAMAYLDNDELIKAKETLLDGLMISPNHEGIRNELEKMKI